MHAYRKLSNETNKFHEKLEIETENERNAFLFTDSRFFILFCLDAAEK